MEPVPAYARLLEGLYACKTNDEAYEWLVGDDVCRFNSCAGVALSNAQNFTLVCVAAALSAHELPSDCAEWRVLAVKSQARARRALHMACKGAMKSKKWLLQRFPEMVQGAILALAREVCTADRRLVERRTLCSDLHINSCAAVQFAATRRRTVKPHFKTACTWKGEPTSRISSLWSRPGGGCRTRITTTCSAASATEGSCAAPPTWPS